MVDSAESTVDTVDAGVNVRPLMLSLTDLLDDCPETEELLVDDFLMPASGASSDTIFIPTEVPVDAGMKRVVTPFFLITVRCGWYDEQHGEFVSPVEYECSASARFPCSSFASSFVNVRSSSRTSESVKTVKGIVESPEAESQKRSSLRNDTGLVRTANINLQSGVTQLADSPMCWD